MKLISLPKSNPKTKGKIAYTQETLLTVSNLITLLSTNLMGKSIRDELNQHLDIKLNDFTEILHDVSVSLFQYLKSLASQPTKRTGEHPDTYDFFTKKELKELALMNLCRIFIIGSQLEPTLTTDTGSSKNTGNLYQFLIEIKPFFEIKSGIKLGSNTSIGRNSFDARKAAVESLQKSK